MRDARSGRSSRRATTDPRRWARLPVYSACGLLFGLLSIVADVGCRARRAPTSGDAPPTNEAVTPPVAGALEGVGDHERFAFALRLDPPEPLLGELFRVETKLFDRRTGKPVAASHFQLDVDMPHHGHGMLTSPRHHEIATGHFLSEGLKLHMPGRWVFRARAEDARGASDAVALPFDQTPDAAR